MYHNLYLYPEYKDSYYLLCKSKVSGIFLILNFFLTCYFLMCIRNKICEISKSSQIANILMFLCNSVYNVQRSFQMHMQIVEVFRSYLIYRYIKLHAINIYINPLV